MEILVKWRYFCSAIYVGPDGESRPTTDLWRIIAMKGNPLTPTLCKLLETSRLLKTTNSKILAASLNRSPATIRTEFQHILAIMNVHCRYAALKEAEDKGWLDLQKTKGEE
jgi:hypothetical protein